MIRRRFKMVLAAGVAAPALLLGANAPSAAELNEALSFLLEVHPQIKAGRNSVEASEQGVNSAFASFLPTVNVTADYGLSYIDSPSRRSTNGEAFLGPRDTAGFSVTQNLFDGYGSTSQYRAAEINVDVADDQLQTTVQTVLFEGVSAYLQVLRQTRQVELTANSEARIKQVLELEDARVQRGSGIAVDVLQAKSRLQIAQERRVAQEGQLANAFSRYVQVFQQPARPAAMKLPSVPDGLVPGSEDAAVEMALGGNPQILVSDGLVDGADERRRTARAGYFPSIDLVGDGNYENDDNATIGVRRDWSLTVRANWDLFSGFRTRSEVSRATFDHAATQDNRDQVVRKVEESVRLAWQQRETARRRVELLENAVNIAGEVFDSRQKLREAGKETAINVLDAENEVINAQINLTAAQYDFRLASFQLLFAMGKLDRESLGF